MEVIVKAGEAVLPALLMHKAAPDGQASSLEGHELRSWMRHAPIEQTNESEVPIVCGNDPIGLTLGD